jgi:hypothetical protein
MMRFGSAWPSVVREGGREGGIVAGGVDKVERG